MSPRSNKSPSPEAKERRARNRAAQLKFRRKKQEVDEIRCNRIKHLEGVVERMSTVLVDFTDGLLQQDVVQQSPGMIASIQGVIADILTLANEAGDPDQGPKTRKARVKATEAQYNSPKDSEHELPTSNFSITSTATPNDPMTAISPIPLTDDSPIKMPLFEDTTVPLPVPTIYSQASYPRSTIPAPLSPLLWTSSLPPLSLDSFICRLTYSCFKVGCLVLSRSIDAPLPLSEESRMFGSTLRYRERDEMILRMRWLLGPGKHELQTLAELPWGGRWWDQEFSGSDLANCATNAAMVDSSAPQFLSVLGVEKQLVALGARFVDKETIELDSSALAILSGNRLEPSCAQPDSWSFVNLFPSKDSRPQIEAPKVRLSINRASVELVTFWNPPHVLGTETLVRWNHEAALTSVFVAFRRIPLGHQLSSLMKSSSRLRMMILNRRSKLGRLQMKSKKIPTLPVSKGTGVVARGYIPAETRVNWLLGPHFWVEVGAGMGSDIIKAFLSQDSEDQQL
ncbi:uncharacterized protein FTJAE_8526 [Fusarium tjaetaba]|uniref:BZIP domain-containing protein n=1 Tax=Fusarium tjaetaba TaxID=1567544 RepID=A0A8H5VP98_9HYPO|nr:uncharacterized protein FTJAE_8526 [Fusarium tjaetaba]KAF5629645.1 hypothetical protein FTJAE_8526 [Fusarium tjaetaba]